MSIEYLKLEGVEAGYDGSPVLRDVNLTLRRGELVAVIGPNGAGKSTLLKTVAGIIKPMRGRVLAGDVSLGSLKPKELARMVVYLPPELPRYTGMRVRDYLLTARSPWVKVVWEGEVDLEVVREAAVKLEVIGLLDKPLSILSSGQLRRVQLAWCVARGGDVLLLDEPLAHLDPKYQASVVRFLREEARGKIVVLAIHDINTALAFCDRIVGVKEGRVLFNVRREALSRRMLEELYDTGFNVYGSGDVKVFLPAV